MTQPPTSQPTEIPPPDLLMEFILSLLAPLLMTAGNTDSTLARLAAQQAIAAYTATGQNQLVTIAQILGFALTALDNLRLSMPADLSLSMKLKLRGNANALNRSSQQAAATLELQRRDTLTPMPTGQPATPPEPVQNETPQQTQALTALQDTRLMLKHAQIALDSQTVPDDKTGLDAKPDIDRRRQLSWASAMTDIAAECSANLTHLPPHQHGLQLVRIGALTKTAQALSRGDVALKSRLLSSTSLQT